MVFDVEDPDPERVRLSRSILDASSLDNVALAISAATDVCQEIYVERLATGWRWSFASRGGAYPLQRIAARFLKCDYHRLLIQFRTADGGWAILCREHERPETPEAWAVLEFDGPTTAADVAARIRSFSNGEVPSKALKQIVQLPSSATAEDRKALAKELVRASREQQRKKRKGS